MTQLTPLDPFGSEPAPQGGKTSVLSEDLVIDGDIQSSHAIEIAGILRGTVAAASISIAPSGRVEGHVVARDLSVFGGITGSVAARSLTLHSGAVVQADVLHERIAIEAGAELDGRLQRNRPRALTPPTAADPAPAAK